MSDSLTKWATVAATSAAVACGINLLFKCAGGGGACGAGKAGGTKAVSRDRGPYDGMELPPHPIWRIAITGGPCSGKSSGMDAVKKEFEGKGFRVFAVPEVATILINGGLDFGKMAATPRGVIEAQKMILQTILRLEDSFYRLAVHAGCPCIILCDRGTMDGRAYCSPAEWEVVLQETGHTMDELRDVRYDAVIHLVTAAIGAEKFYTIANNAARSETPEQAAKLDEQTRVQWLGHRLVGIIDNSSDFKTKMTRVTDFVGRLVATHAPGQRANLTVYELPAPPKELAKVTHAVEVSVHYLFPRAQYTAEQVIRRSTATSDIFYLRGHAVGGSVNYVPITAREFTTLLEEREDKRVPVVSKRHESFFHGMHYWTVTTILAPQQQAGRSFLQAPVGVDPKTEVPHLGAGKEVDYTQALFPKEVASRRRLSV